VTVASRSTAQCRRVVALAKTVCGHRSCSPNHGSSRQMHVGAIPFASICPGHRALRVVGQLDTTMGGTFCPDGPSTAHRLARRKRVRFPNRAFQRVRSSGLVRDQWPWMTLHFPSARA
jgi:hypothetical protein